MTNFDEIRPRIEDYRLKFGRRGQPLDADRILAEIDDRDLATSKAHKGGGYSVILGMP